MGIIPGRVIRHSPRTSPNIGVGPPMPTPTDRPAPAPPDARHAAVRTRDAVRAAFARAGVPPGPDGAVEVVLAEPEVALPVAGLSRAVGAAARDGSAHLAPGGGWAGAPFPEPETYVTSWEMELIATRRAAVPRATALAVGGEAVLEMIEGVKEYEALLVHHDRSWRTTSGFALVSDVDVSG